MPAEAGEGRVSLYWVTRANYEVAKSFASWLLKSNNYSEVNGGKLTVKSATFRIDAKNTQNSSRQNQVAIWHVCAGEAPEWVTLGWWDTV